MANDAKYYTVLTNYGNAEVLKAITEERKINIIEIAVGDGNGSNYMPDVSQTHLKNEVWRGTANVCISTKNSIEVKGVLPGDVGGFTIREMGAYDDAGRLIAICNTPDSPKVTVEDGVVHEMDLCMEIMFVNSNVQDIINLVIDPNITVATKGDIENIKKELEDMSTPIFLEWENKENIESGETTSVIFGKIKKWLSDLREGAFATIVNHCLATAPGTVLDGRVGKDLQEQIRALKQENEKLKKVDEQINSNMGFDTKLVDGVPNWSPRGADTWSPFRSGAKLIDLGVYNSSTNIDVSVYIDDPNAKYSVICGSTSMPSTTSGSAGVRGTYSGFSASCVLNTNTQKINLSVSPARVATTYGDSAAVSIASNVKVYLIKE